MTTVRDIITQSLKRLRVVAAGESPAASDVADGLVALNQMIYNWATNGVDVKHQGFALTDTFTFWIPPAYLDVANSTSTVMDDVTYKGTWNASTNSPTLVSSAGTKGDLYKVLTTGTTTLDDVSLWTAGDFLIFNGAEWLKGDSAAKREQGVVAMLAVRLADDYGMQVPPVVARDADDGWKSLLQQFTRVPDASFDKALTRLPSRRWPYSVPADEST